MERFTTFKGSSLSLGGTPIEAGQELTQSLITLQSLEDKRIQELFGEVTLLITVPSLDTPVCDLETKKFQENVRERGEKLKLIAVSCDLPFALSRWCGSEKSPQFAAVSDHHHLHIGAHTGTLIKEWRVLSRAVFVLDKTSKVHHAEYVAELSEEPDYEKALTVVDDLL